MKTIFQRPIKDFDSDKRVANQFTKDGKLNFASRKGMTKENDPFQHIKYQVDDHEHVVFHEHKLFSEMDTPRSINSYDEIESYG